MTSLRLIMKRNPISTALLIILAITKSVGSDAGALPVNIKFKNKESNTSTCQAAKLTDSNGQCSINRGGASTATTFSDIFTSTSPSPESLVVIGAVGAWFKFRERIIKSTREFWRDAERTKFLLAGAVSGIVSRTAVAPLEVVATAQMVRGGNNGMINELMSLFKTEGIRGFFKGNGANCLKVAPTKGVQFFAFESFKVRLVSWKKKSLGLSDDSEVKLTPIERLVAGGFAGMVASSLVYPIEVVKTMLTMYPGKYNGITAAFRGVLKEVGPRGLYAGLPPTLVAMFPYVGIEFMIYETSKIAIESLMSRRSTSDEEVDISLPIIISLGLGALAGAAAQSAAHPLDVVRKRLQVQGINGNPVLYKSTLDCFLGVASKEGMSALYKGLGPACVATIPGTGIAYITYEFMKNYLGLKSQ